MPIFVRRRRCPRRRRRPCRRDPLRGLSESALLGLEVDVLERLDRAGALYGEDLTLTRPRSGYLRLEGMVDRASSGAARSSTRWARSRAFRSSRSGCARSPMPASHGRRPETPTEHAGLRGDA